MDKGKCWRGAEAVGAPSPLLPFRADGFTPGLQTSLSGAPNTLALTPPSRSMLRRQAMPQAEVDRASLKGPTKWPINSGATSSRSTAPDPIQSEELTSSSVFLRDLAGRSDREIRELATWTLGDKMTAELLDQLRRQELVMLLSAPGVLTRSGEAAVPQPQAVVPAPWAAAPACSPQRQHTPPAAAAAPTTEGAASAVAPRRGRWRRPREEEASPQRKSSEPVRRGLTPSRSPSRSSPGGSREPSKSRATFLSSPAHLEEAERQNRLHHFILRRGSRSPEPKSPKVVQVHTLLSSDDQSAKPISTLLPRA